MRAGESKPSFVKAHADKFYWRVIELLSTRERLIGVLLVHFSSDCKLCKFPMSLFFYDKINNPFLFNFDIGEDYYYVLL